MTPTIDKHFFAEGERIVQASIATDPVTGDPHLAERSMSRQKALDMLCDLLEALAPTGNTPGNATEGQCATKRLIANVRQRWEELGYNEPERLAERLRGDQWRAFYHGWIEGRWPLVVGAGKGVECDWNAIMPKVEAIARQRFADGDMAYMRTFGMTSDDGNMLVRINRYPLHEAPTLIEAVRAAVAEYEAAEHQARQ